MSRYSRQRQRASFNPLMYGRTAIDLTSVVGSLLDARFLISLPFAINEYRSLLGKGQRINGTFP